MKNFIQHDLEAVITNYPDVCITSKKRGNRMLSNKKLFLFDIDGTVCQGERLIDGTMQFLEDIRQSGGQFVFITNNSTKSIQDYILKFQKLGIKTDYSNFITASYATIHYLKKNYDDKLIYVMEQNH